MAVLTNFPENINAVDARDTLNAILSRLGTLEGAGSGITLALSAAQSSAEGTTQTYTVTRTGNMNVDVIVNYTTAGTGTNPLNAADHQGGAFPAGAKTIPAGVSTVTIPIVSNDDTDIETDETGLLTISSPTANVTITKASSVYTFTNNDTAPPVNNTVFSGTTADTGFLDAGSTHFKIDGTIDATAWEIYFGCVDNDGRPGYRAFPKSPIRFAIAKLQDDGSESEVNGFNFAPNPDVTGGVPFTFEVNGNQAVFIVNGETVVNSGNFNMGGGTFTRFRTGGPARPSIIITRL